MEFFFFFFWPKTNGEPRMWWQYGIFKSPKWWRFIVPVEFKPYQVDILTTPLTPTISLLEQIRQDCFRGKGETMIYQWRRCKTRSSMTRGDYEKGWIYDDFMDFKCEDSLRLFYMLIMLGNYGSSWKNDLEKAMVSWCTNCKERWPPYHKEINWLHGISQSSTIMGQISLFCTYSTMHVRYNQDDNRFNLHLTNVMITLETRH